MKHIHPNSAPNFTVVIKEESFIKGGLNYVDEKLCDF
jgi:hypothetical protein